MSANSNIAWTDHTGGPWLICSEVSPGCAHCYARKLLERMLGPIIRKAYRRAGLDDWETRPIWGDKAPRVATKGFWKDARRLNKKAAAEGKRLKMFPSMIDWLDDMPAGIIDQEGNWLDRDKVLADFLTVIYECQNLDWLLLTKRPENWLETLDAARLFLGRKPEFEWVENWICDRQRPDNVWIGVSVENQKMADERIPQLLEIPAALRFLSCEPLLGRVELLGPYEGPMAFPLGNGIHWVIIGGESGPGFREMDISAAVAIAERCQFHDVPFFMKQDSGLYPGKQGRIPNEWWRHELPAVETAHRAVATMEVGA